VDALLFVTFSALSIFAMLVILGWLSTVSAAIGINSQLTYQGKLNDNTGQAVADASYDLKFTLYDASSGGTCLWTAVGACDTADYGSVSITTVNGVFSVTLGASGQNSMATSSVDFNTDALYLGVTVESDSEMTPRKRLTASPYAFNADLVDGFSATSTAATANTLLALDSSGNLNLFNRGVSSTQATTTALFLVPQTTAPDSIEGRLYYDAAANTLYVYNGTSWQDALGGGSISDWEFGVDSTYITPTSSVGLLINASTTIAANFRVDGNSVVTGNATTTGNFTVGTSTLFVMHDPFGTGNDRVGIGTTHPAGAIHTYNPSGNSMILDHDGSYQVSMNFITLGNGTQGLNTVGTQGWHMVARGNQYTDSAAQQNDLLFTYFDDTTADMVMYFDHEGNVGINDASPRSLFTVGSSDGFMIDDSGNATSSGWFNIGTTDVIGTLGGLIGAGDLYVGGDATTTGSLHIGSASLRLEDGSIYQSTGDLTLSTASGLIAVSDDFRVSGYASSTNFIFSDNGSNTASVPDLYVSSGDLYFDGTQLTGTNGLSQWQYTFDGNLTPTSSSAGLYVTASSTIAANFRVDGNATTTGRLVLGTTNPTNNFGKIWIGGDAYVSGSVTTTNTIIAQGGFGVTGVGTADEWFNEVGGYGVANGGSGVILRQNNANKLIVGSSDIRPGGDGTISLGTSALKWSDLYVTGFVIEDGSASTTGNLLVGGNATTTGNFTVGTSTLFVMHDPSGTQNHRVGIGTSGPTKTLTVVTSGAAVAGSPNTVAIFQKSEVAGTNAGIDIVAGNVAQSEIHFNDTDGTGGSLIYSHLNSLYQFSGGDVQVTGANLNVAGSVLASSTGVFSDDVVAYSDLFVDTSTLVVNASQNNIGVRNASPNSTYLLDIASNSTDDWNKVIFIDHDNNGEEDYNVFEIDSDTSEADVDGVTRTIKNIALDIDHTTAVSSIAGAPVLNKYGIDNSVGLGGLTFSNTDAGIITTNIYGSNTTIDGNPIYNDLAQAADTNTNIYGVKSHINTTPTLTNISTGNGNFYAGHFDNSLVWGGAAGHTVNAYGLYATSDNNLTTTGNTAHYAGYFNAAGSADTNYGMYTSVTGASTNYGVYIKNEPGIGTSYGVFATSTATAAISPNYGVYSKAQYGTFAYGVYGEAVASSATVGYGVYGKSEASGALINYGIYGEASGATTNYAGYFSGNLYVSGNSTTTGNIYLGSGSANFVWLDDGKTDSASDTAAASSTQLVFDANAYTAAIPLDQKYTLMAAAGDSAAWNPFLTVSLSSSYSGTNEQYLFNVLRGTGISVGMGSASDDDGIYFDSWSGGAVGAVGTESLIWDDNPGEFDLSDDLNIAGSATTTGTLVVGSTNPSGLFDATDAFIVGDLVVGNTSFNDDYSLTVLTSNSTADESDLRGVFVDVNLSANDTTAVTNYGQYIDVTDSGGVGSGEIIYGQYVSTVLSGSSATSEVSSVYGVYAFADHTGGVGGGSVVRNNYGVYGVADSATSAASDRNYGGVFLANSSGEVEIGIFASTSTSPTIPTSGSYAAYFQGDTYITGAIYNPGMNLDVASDQCVYYNSTTKEITYGVGTGCGTGGHVIEKIDAAPTDQDLAPGEVVVVDPNNDESVARSTKAYDPTVMGVISATENAFNIGGHGDVYLTLAGRLKVKVSGENGKIRRGDPVTTSNTPGHGMVATQSSVGVFGLALEEFNPSAPTDTGEILVLIRSGVTLPPSEPDTGSALVVDDTPSNQQIVVIENPDVDINTIVVREAATFYGTITIVGEARFTHTAVFEKHLIVGVDTAGTGVIALNATSTEVLFTEEYEAMPRVTATGRRPIALGITDISVKGFRVYVTEPVDEDLTFDWIALAHDSADDLAQNNGSGPIITALTATHVTAQPGDEVGFAVFVTDPDTTDGALTFSWSVQPMLGEMSGSGSAQMTWTVGEVTESMTVIITVMVSDGQHQATQNKTVTVVLSTDGVLPDDPNATTTSTTTPPIIAPEPTTIVGCTDGAAENFNPDATNDDGSCTYSEEIASQPADTPTTTDEVVQDDEGDITTSTF